MATAPEAVRGQLAVVTSAAGAEIASEVATQPASQQVAVALALAPLVVPSYYDAAGSLAVAWYDELRDESAPTAPFAPEIIGDPATDWIEREVAKFQRQIEDEIEADAQRVLDETLRLIEKEIARGFRDTITGNTRIDTEAIGWSRVARPGACKLCRMLAARGAVYSESTAIFAAHTDCTCAARPEFANGDHGPEASVEQYLASSKRRTPAQRALLRAYLTENYPDAPG